MVWAGFSTPLFTAALHRSTVQWGNSKRNWRRICSETAKNRSKGRKIMEQGQRRGL